MSFNKTKLVFGFKNQNETTVRSDGFVRKTSVITIYPEMLAYKVVTLNA